MNTTKLTQAQAARAAGVSHAAIWRAIKNGRLSAERTDDGSVRVDASELQRVFPRADLERAHKLKPNGTLNTREHTDDAGEIQALRVLVEELQTDKRTLHTEIGRMHAELERAARERMQAAEERARLLSMLEAKDRLLTDQRERAERRRWWQRWRRSE